MPNQESTNSFLSAINRSNEHDNAIRVTDALRGISLSKEKADAIQNIIKGFKKPKQTVIFNGNGSLEISPFITLDDAVTSGSKVSSLIYENGNFKTDIVKSAALVAGSENEDETFEALAELLAVALMNVGTSKLENLKSTLNKKMSEKALNAVNQNTEKFLKERGFSDFK